MSTFEAIAHTQMKEPMIGVTLDGRESLLAPSEAMRLRRSIGAACAELYRERKDVRAQHRLTQCNGCGRPIGHEPTVRDDFGTEFHEDCEELYRD